MSVLALDIGTSSTKALLASWDGEVIAVESAPTPTASDAPGQLAFPAERVLSVAADLITGLAAAVSTDPIDTVTFSCLGTAMVPLDASGSPLGAALSPADARPGSIPGSMDLVAMPRERLFRLTGQDPRLSSSLLHWLWWREAHPCVVERLHRFRSLRGYLVHALCGADAEDASWASRTSLLDLETWAWSEEVLAATELPREVLPEVHPATAYWPVSSDVAARLGLAPDARVVLGGMDNCCSFLGASDPAEERLVNIVGTYEHLAGTGALDAAWAAAEAVDGLVHCFVLPDRYLSLSRVPFGHLLTLVEERCGRSLPDLMDGVSIRPAGVTMPLDEPAVIAALEAGIPPGTVVQQLLEASAAILRRSLDAWMAHGAEVGRIVAVGGGAAYDRPLMLKSTLMRRSISTLESDEGGAIGALRLAAIAVRGASLREACERFANPVARTWSPATGGADVD